jgi:hypothetical protein
MGKFLTIYVKPKKRALKHPKKSIIMCFHLSHDYSHENNME